MNRENSLLKCPFCHKIDNQVKAGIHNGVQRYKCKSCNRRYLLELKPRGTAIEIRQQAVDLHASGISMREVAHRLGLKPRNVINWVHAAKAIPPDIDASIAADSSNTDDPPAKRNENTKESVNRRPTIHDVAQMAEVASSTVSNYLNNKGRMSDATRERIRSVMEILRFTPNSLTKALRERRSYILGVVTFGLNDLGETRRQPIVSELLGGINQGAMARNYNVLLYTSLLKDTSASAGVQFLDGKVDGLIWVGAHSDEQRDIYVAQAGLPVMSLLIRNEVQGIGYVDVDNINAVKKIVAHLVDQGHRRIAYIGPNYSRTFLDRIEGYRQGLHIAGIPIDRKLIAANEAISRCWLHDHFTGAYEQAIERWLSMPDPVTAIVFSTDLWAEWGIEFMQKMGLRIPQDVAVTGFDDVSFKSNPQTILTSYNQDFQEIGRLGVLSLIDMIEGDPCEKHRIMIPGRLVIRTSSGRHEG